MGPVVQIQIWGGGGSISCVFYTLLKVVSHNDLSVLSMSAVGFQNRKF